MTKRDFEAVAKLLNRWVLDDGLRSLLFVEFGNEFSARYRNFDRVKWFNARKNKT